MFYFCLCVHCATYFMFISSHSCSNLYLFYFKVKIPKTLRPAKEFVAYNVANEEIFSVNMARRLEKFPTPAISV